jgi:hypothetical protein
MQERGGCNSSYRKSLFMVACGWQAKLNHNDCHTTVLHASESNAHKDLNVNIKTGTVAVSFHKDGSASLATLGLNMCE